MPAVTRARFVEAVERALPAIPAHPSYQLQVWEKEALRRVARTAPRFRTGAFGYGTECGCPVTQAGLYSPGYNHRAMSFGGRFDSALEEVTGQRFQPRLFDDFTGVIVDVID